MDGLLYDQLSEYSNRDAIYRFNEIDFVFIESQTSLKPWHSRAKDVLILLRSCQKNNKLYYATGGIAYCVQFLLSAKDKHNLSYKVPDKIQALLNTTGTITQQQKEQCQVDSASGNIYVFDLETNLWKQIGNVGFYNTRQAKRPFKRVHQWRLQNPNQMYREFNQVQIYPVRKLTASKLLTKVQFPLLLKKQSWLLTPQQHNYSFTTCLEDSDSFVFAWDWRGCFIALWKLSNNSSQLDQLFRNWLNIQIEHDHWFQNAAISEDQRVHVAKSSFRDTRLGLIRYKREVPSSGKSTRLKSSIQSHASRILSGKPKGESSQLLSQDPYLSVGDIERIEQKRRRKKDIQGKNILVQRSVQANFISNFVLQSSPYKTGVSFRTAERSKWVSSRNFVV